MAKSKLQQKRSRETRQSIIAAAEKLWRKASFDKVPVDDICRAANVAKGTFYFYFPRKEHLLVMLVFGHFMPHKDEVTSFLQSRISTLEVLFHLCSAMARRVQKLPRVLVLRAVEESFQIHRDIARIEGGNLFLRTYFKMVFTRARERGEICTDWDIDILAGMMGWNVLQEIFMWADGQTQRKNLEPNLLQRAELTLGGAASTRAPLSDVRAAKIKTLLKARRKTELTSIAEGAL